MHWITKRRRELGVSSRTLARAAKMSAGLLMAVEEDGWVTHPGFAEAICVQLGATAAEFDQIVPKCHQGEWKPGKGALPKLGKRPMAAEAAKATEAARAAEQARLRMERERWDRAMLEAETRRNAAMGADDEMEIIEDVARKLADAEPVPHSVAKGSGSGFAQKASVPITMLRRDGTVIATFFSAYSADRATGYGLGYIRYQYDGRKKGGTPHFDQRHTFRLATAEEIAAKMVYPDGTPRAKLGGNGLPRRAVVELDMQGTVTRRWPDVSEAAGAYDVDPTYVIRRCNGRVRDDFKKLQVTFRYADDYDRLIAGGEEVCLHRVEKARARENGNGWSHKARRIVLIDAKGNAMMIFDSMNQAMRETGCNSNFIVQRCKRDPGMRNEWKKGYSFRYAEEEK